jgi:prephenate dehydratase
VSESPPRVAYLGPAGTNTDEALRASAAGDVTEEPRSTVREAIMAVQLGETEQAVVPIENSLEGGVAATLDALAGDADRVRIVREVVLPIRHRLISRGERPLSEIERVVSHPQAVGQCARFLREQLGHARVAGATSTSEAVRIVCASDEPWAAIGSALAAELYGGTIVADAIEDRSDNVTRFVWLAHADAGQPPIEGPAKTSIVFWGFNDASPGALVSVLRELSERDINLTKIESRPRRVRLGHYMFFADLEGWLGDHHVDEALRALRARVETLKVLGTYPAAPSNTP